MDMKVKRAGEFPGIALRLKALFFDWLFITGYLLLLLIVTLLFYFLAFQGIPELTNLQSQFIATVTSVIPLIALFSILEGSQSHASLGKRKAGLTIRYKGSPRTGSILRNTLKFLPWQFGHMSTIHGLYHDFDTPFSMVFLTLSMALSLVYILMAFLRKDNRHLADLLAGSTVVKNNKS